MYHYQHAIATHYRRAQYCLVQYDEFGDAFETMFQLGKPSGCFIITTDQSKVVYVASDDQRGMAMPTNEQGSNGEGEESVCVRGGYVCNCGVYI